jgi:hypothetical protein
MGRMHTDDKAVAVPLQRAPGLGDEERCVCLQLHGARPHAFVAMAATAYRPMASDVVSMQAPCNA